MSGRNEIRNGVVTSRARRTLRGGSGTYVQQLSPTSFRVPNVDLTAHLFRAPRGAWVGFNTYVSFGTTGVGETHSVLHNVDGPFGTSS